MYFIVFDRITGTIVIATGSTITKESELAFIRTMARLEVRRRLAGLADVMDAFFPECPMNANAYSIDVSFLVDPPSILFWPLDESRRDRLRVQRKEQNKPGMAQRDSDNDYLVSVEFLDGTVNTTMDLLMYSGSLASLSRPIPRIKDGFSLQGQPRDLSTAECLDPLPAYDEFDALFAIASKRAKIETKHTWDVLHDVLEDLKSNKIEGWPFEDGGVLF